MKIRKKCKYFNSLGAVAVLLCIHFNSFILLAYKFITDCELKNPEHRNTNQSPYQQVCTAHIFQYDNRAGFLISKV